MPVHTILPKILDASWNYERFYFHDKKFVQK